MPTGRDRTYRSAGEDRVEIRRHERNRTQSGTAGVKRHIPEGLERFEADWHFTHAVEARGLVFCSGVTGTSVNGRVDADPAAQFHQAFEHLRVYLEAAGCSIDGLVEITSYHVGLREHLEAFLAVKDLWIEPPYPAWSAIGVSELITPGALVEIRAVAEPPGSRIS
ncbi:RidA family protein [Thermoleophilia bacterium SCSIO 60948]|nr:RidA family protein [Thermoleophilia bacterium SCSIO 60948]